MADVATPPAETTIRFETVTLAQPILRGEQVISTITLRKPKAGELRNLNLGELINSDVTAVLKLIPRISDPVLTPHECNELDVADLTEIGGTIRGFFMTRAEKQVMEAMLAEHQPKT